MILKIVNERLNDTFGLTIAPIPTKVKALTKQQMAEIKQSQMSQSASQSVAQLLNADTSTESATQTQGNDNERQRKNLPHVWVKFLFHRPTGIGYSLKIVRN